MRPRPRLRPERVRPRTRPSPKKFSRPRPDTLKNNSVCMSMKTKILAFRTVFSKHPTEMTVDGYIVNIN